ncbi:hypothetical protein GCM10022631_27220 [Deinococcus rubellus]
MVVPVRLPSPVLRPAKGSKCVKEGSKLRARVVQDSYHPDWNMRFPRSIREDGLLYVVDEVNTEPGGKSYIAFGAIRRLVQPR